MNSQLRNFIRRVLLEAKSRAPEKPYAKAGRWQATIYFDSPIAAWLRRAPAENEILAQRSFRWRWLAEIWAGGRARGFQNILWRVDRT